MFRIKTVYWCFVLLSVVYQLTALDVDADESAAPKGIEFKIHTEVFGEDPQLPVSSNLTLFAGNSVFDFRFGSKESREPVEVAILDIGKRQFMLLDMKRQIRLKIDNLQLLRILEGMGKELKLNRDSSFLVFEEFQEDYQIQENRVTVSNELISYSAKGERPEQDGVLQRYIEFLEQYTLLSAADPKRMPPFARLRLNSAIRKYGFLPTSVSLVVKASEFNRIGFQASSRHRIVMEMDSYDRELIESAKRNWARFREVELAEYRELATEGDSEAVERR